MLDVPAPDVQLTYDEAVEPRFAIISVTDAAGQQETTGPVQPLARRTRTRWSYRCARTCPRAGT